jgi:glycosyltransferase involved in cell wall biosynthesis
MIFRGRLGLQQRVLPVYRAPFFEALADACTDGLGIFAGLPRPDEAIAVTDSLKKAPFTPARNYHFLCDSLYLCWQGGLIQWLEDWLPSALIVEANPRYLSTPAAVRWMQRRGGPVIGWGLGTQSPAKSSSFPRKWVEKQRGALRLSFLSQFDALIAYSARGAEEYAALGFPAARIFVAPNAAAPRPTHPPPARQTTFAGRPSVLFVGRLQARKRLDHLLYACASLEEKIQPRLVIVGDGPERQTLEDLAKKVYPSAEFAGPKYQDELSPYFDNADLFVLPGTGGLAIQEAMSHGLPIIVAQGDGTQDDLVRAGNGWQIPPDNPGALKETLGAALSDASRLRAMGAESYRIVMDEINMEKMVEVFAGVLSRLFEK